jgi:ADP-dependent NAD(P)H-hydrate dehydratase
MVSITDALLRRWSLPDPTKGGTKEQRGRALIIAGAEEMPGAAILASTAALRSGCGKVRVAVPESATTAVGCAVPELFVLPVAGRASLRAIVDSAGKARAVLIGPGMRDTAAIRFLLPRLLRLNSIGALIVDATALHLLHSPQTSHVTRPSPLILTPHFSEAATLCGVTPEKIARAPQRYAREMADRFRATVVLKSAESVICSPDSGVPVYLNKRGNIGLATAGSGDVLAGIIAGLCARAADPVQSAVWSVALHARAGERLAKKMGAVGYLAHELNAEIPRLIDSLS